MTIIFQDKSESSWQQRTSSVESSHHSQDSGHRDLPCHPVTARARGATRGLELRNETVQVLISNSLCSLKIERTGGWKAAGYGDESCLRPQTRGGWRAQSSWGRSIPMPSAQDQLPWSLLFPVPAFKAGTGQVSRQCFLSSLALSRPNKTHRNFYTAAVKTLHMLSIDVLLAFRKGGLPGVWNYLEPLRRNSWNTNRSRDWWDICKIIFV